MTLYRAGIWPGGEIDVDPFHMLGTHRSVDLPRRDLHAALEDQDLAQLFEADVTG